MTNPLLELLDRLGREHVEVREALAALGPPAQAGDLVELAARLPGCASVLGPALNEHSALEDEQLFPAVAALLGEDMVGTFAGEHDRIRALRDEVYDGLARGSVTAGVCIELCELLGDHIDREDEALFPAARGVLGDQD